MRNFQITISLQCDNLTIESNSPMRYPSLSTVQESNFVKSWLRQIRQDCYNSID